jgi:hypothetical protein
MSSSKVEKMIKKLSDDLEKLKVAAKLCPESAKVSKVKERPSSIDICTRKSELALFTVAELKAWLVAKKVEKLSGLCKDELIKRVKKQIKKSVVVTESTGSSTSVGDIDDEAIDSVAVPMLPPVQMNQLSEQEFMSMIMMYLQSKQQ